MTSVQSKSSRIANVDIVVTRADGSVENWGRMTHATPLRRYMYNVTHPVLIIKRIIWNRRARWRAQLQTPA